MEFDLDRARVQTILTNEYDRARQDIAQHGPTAALAHSQQRHDDRLAAAPDAHSLACKAGCFWCCYFSVDVRPVEVLRIVEFLERDIAPEDRSRIVAEVTTNAAVLGSLDDDQRVRSNTKCPFLYLGRCSIYSVRPQTCRNYHATDARGCEKAYEEPDNDDIDPEFAPLVYQTGAAHVEAFSKALGELGYDMCAYELNTALAAALANPEMTRRRFEAKDLVFPQLDGIEVPTEFGD